MREFKKYLLKIRLLTVYTCKMLTKPKNTVFEINGIKTNRFKYTKETARYLWKS